MRSEKRIVGSPSAGKGVGMNRPGVTVLVALGRLVVADRVGVALANPLDADAAEGRTVVESKLRATWVSALAKGGVATLGVLPGVS